MSRRRLANRYLRVKEKRADLERHIRIVRSVQQVRMDAEKLSVEYGIEIKHLIKTTSNPALLVWFLECISDQIGMLLVVRSELTQRVMEDGKERLIERLRTLDR